MAQRTFAGARLAGTLALLAGLFGHVGTPVSAHAQVALGEPRWLPWLGCWAPSAASPTALPELTGIERVCVFPDESAGVRIASITDDRITTRGAIPGIGLQQSVSREGCAGWERATWAADGKRLYRRAELICEGGTRQVTTGMFALLSAAEWAEIEATTVGRQTAVRIVRYREAADTTDAVRVVIGSLAGRSLAMRSARMAAAAVPTIDEVIEASRNVDPAVVEAWLVHRRPALEVSARELARMADAGVASPVIDVVVELSHPGVAGGRLGSGAYAVTRLGSQRPVVTAVALQPAEPATVFQQQDGPAAVGGGPDVYNNYNYYYRNLFDQWGFHPLSYYGLYPYGGLGIIYRTGLFAYPRYRTSFPNRYYHDPYYPPYYPPYGPPPRYDDPKTYPGRGRVIVVSPPARYAPPIQPQPTEPPPHGRAVNGRGYTQSSGSGGGAAAGSGAQGVYAPPAPQADGGRSARSREVVASPVPRGTSGAGSSGGSGSTGRTAQPRRDPPKAQASPPPAKGQSSTGESKGSSGSSSTSGRTAKARPPRGG
jgi:hypothetical protein